MFLVIWTTPFIAANFWVWILDAGSVIDISDEWWSFIWPKNGIQTYEDTWVQANTWVVEYVEVAVKKWEGTAEFDYKT